MGTCPSDASGFRFYGEYDLEYDQGMNDCLRRDDALLANPGAPWGQQHAEGGPQGLRQPRGAPVWVNSTPVLCFLCFAWGRSPRLAVLLDPRRKFEAEDHMSLKGLGRRRGGSSPSVPGNSNTTHSPRGKENCPGEHQCPRDRARVCRVGRQRDRPPAPRRVVSQHPLGCVRRGPRRGVEEGEVSPVPSATGNFDGVKMAQRVGPEEWCLGRRDAPGGVWDPEKGRRAGE